MSFTSKPSKFLYFEIARLRTLYDSKPEIHEAIIERYGRVVKELDGRGAKWFWAPHPMDQFIDIKKSFIKPNKPAWRIFTPEEVFGITGFELPVLVDIKIDGMRLQIHNEDGVKIFSEDEGFNKTNKFKDPLEDIKKLPEGTILDAEGVLVADGQVLHRTSFIGYVNGKGFDEEKDKQAEFWVFDVLKWAGKDLMDEPLGVRLSYLKKVPGAGHLKTFKVGEESFICKTREEVLSAIKKVAGKKGSEGAMIKILSSGYVKDIHNKGWIKLKNLKEVDCLVVEIEQPKHLKGPLQGQSIEGVYNYHVAAGPYSDADGKVLLDKVPTKVRELKGDVYAHLGKTFNTEIKAKVGDVIRVWSPEINKYEVKDTGLFTYGIYEPKVLEWVHERNIPDSLNVLNRLAEETSELHPREVTKQDEDPFLIEDQAWLVKDGDWITINGRHLFIGEGENLEFALHGPKFSVSRDANTRTYSLADNKGKGYVDIYDRDLAVIDLVVVSEKERGKGYGRYLVNRIESDLRENGVKTVHVSAIPSAIPFWDKLGYKTYLEKPDVSSLSPRSAQAKLEVWEGRRSKDLKTLVKGIGKEESNSMYLPRHSCMLIWSGVKTLIVKEKHFEGMLKKKLNLCDDNYKYGDITLTRMFEMSREEVDRSRKRSKLTDLDMEDWKGAQTFYGYDFEFEPLEEPQEVKVPHGAQTFFNILKQDEGGDGGHWVTVNGRHIFLEEGESPREAFRRERLNKEKIPETMKDRVVKDSNGLKKYASMNERRKELWSAYQKELDKAPTGFDELITRRVIIGSFVTGKDYPSDIDVVVFTDPNYDFQVAPDNIQSYYWKNFETARSPSSHQDVSIMFFDDTERGQAAVDRMIAAGQGKIRGYGSEYKGIQH